MVVLASAAAINAAGATLEGVWVLVEQRYGEGDVNLVVDDPPLRLEFRSEGGALKGRVLPSRAGAAALDWPAFPVDGRATPLSVEGLDFAVGGRAVVATYEVQPAAGDPPRLRIVESYRLSDDGRVLTGTVRVQFLAAADEQGSYLLHRRFERQ